jgi:hypothetical protein
LQYRNNTYKYVNINICDITVLGHREWIWSFNVVFFMNEMICKWYNGWKVSTWGALMLQYGFILFFFLILSKTVCTV